MTRYFAGIGSRLTPEFILTKISKYSRALVDLGYILRSGGAGGADKAFESGIPTPSKEIFTDKDATKESMLLAAKHHPHWSKCNDLAKKFHGRNTMIVLGKDLKTPVDFVICYTLNGLTSGGTGQGIRVAISRKIPVFNLFFEDQANSLDDLIIKLRESRENNLKPIS